MVRTNSYNYAVVDGSSDFLLIIIIASVTSLVIVSLLFCTFGIIAGVIIQRTSTNKYVMRFS